MQIWRLLFKIHWKEKTSRDAIQVYIILLIHSLVYIQITVYKLYGLTDTSLHMKYVQNNNYDYNQVLYMHHIYIFKDKEMK